jgi:hypothetical protein
MVEGKQSQSDKEPIDEPLPRPRDASFHFTPALQEKEFAPIMHRRYWSKPTLRGAIFGTVAVSLIISTIIFGVFILQLRLGSDPALAGNHQLLEERQKKAKLHSASANPLTVPTGPNVSAPKILTPQSESTTSKKAGNNENSSSPQERGTPTTVTEQNGESKINTTSAKAPTNQTHTSAPLPSSTPPAASPAPSRSVSSGETTEASGVTTRVS